MEKDKSLKNERQKQKYMKQWNHQKRDRMLLEKRARNIANNLELQKK